MTRREATAYGHALMSSVYGDYYQKDRHNYHMACVEPGARPPGGYAWFHSRTQAFGHWIFDGWAVNRDACRVILEYTLPVASYGLRLESEASARYWHNPFRTRRETEFPSARVLAEGQPLTRPLYVLAPPHGWAIPWLLGYGPKSLLSDMDHVNSLTREAREIKTWLDMLDTPDRLKAVMGPRLLEIAQAPDTPVICLLADAYRKNFQEALDTPGHPG